MTNGVDPYPSSDEEEDPSSKEEESPSDPIDNETQSTSEHG